ncbi:MAG: hypothetical protein LBG43_08070 [Treponema sp.]|nr:hypothetical protein [Treponema sp.]
MEKSGREARETLQLFDLMFMVKLILKEASPPALVHFINGLFDKNHPPDNAVARAMKSWKNSRPIDARHSRRRSLVEQGGCGSWRIDHVDNA